MTREAKFETFAEHPFHGKQFSRLGKTELFLARDFLRANAELDDNAFMEKANRFQLDRPKTRNFAIVWGLLIQTVDTVGNIRRRKLQEAK